MKNLKIPRKLKKEIVKVESKSQSAVWVKPQIIGVLLKPGVKRNKWTNKLINRIINEQKNIFKNLVQENINNLKNKNYGSISIMDCVCNSRGGDLSE
jgi:hypothetical protein